MHKSSLLLRTHAFPRKTTYVYSNIIVLRYQWQPCNSNIYITMKSTKWVTTLSQIQQAMKIYKINAFLVMVYFYNALPIKSALKIDSRVAYRRGPDPSAGPASSSSDLGRSFCRILPMFLSLQTLVYLPLHITWM